MADIILTQAEADGLIALEKFRLDKTEYEFPQAGATLIVPLKSTDKRENFLLDISRGTIRLAKTKYQTRARQTIVLVRLELEGPKHQNPDGLWIPCPHIHLYREGFADKWAFPVPANFRNLSDNMLSLGDFMGYCNIIDPPLVKRGLFT
jgi:hypothetical protein